MQKAHVPFADTRDERAASEDRIVKQGSEFRFPTDCSDYQCLLAIRRLFAKLLVTDQRPACLSRNTRKQHRKYCCISSTSHRSCPDSSAHLVHRQTSGNLTTSQHPSELQSHPD